MRDPASIYIYQYVYFIKIRRHNLPRPVPLDPFSRAPALQPDGRLR